jgi:hypothetical protein
VAGRRRSRKRKRGETEQQFLERCKRLDQDAARKERQRQQDRSERQRVQETRTQLERRRRDATVPKGDPIYVRAFADSDSLAEATGQLEAVRIADESHEKWKNRFDSFADNVSADEGHCDPWDFIVREPPQKCEADRSNTTGHETTTKAPETDNDNQSKSHDDALRNFVEILGLGPTGEILSGKGGSPPTPTESHPPRPVPAKLQKMVFYIGDLTHPEKPLLLEPARAVLTNTRAYERGRSLFASAGCEPVLRLPEPPAPQRTEPLPESPPLAAPKPPPVVAPPSPAPSYPWHETVMCAVLVRWLQRARQERRGPLVVRVNAVDRTAWGDVYGWCRAWFGLGALDSMAPLPRNCSGYALMMSLLAEALRMAQDVTEPHGLLNLAQYIKSAAPDDAQLVRCRMAKNHPSEVYRAYRQSVQTEMEAGRLVVLTDRGKENDDDERRAS